jgi:hypothetical protein
LRARAGNCLIRAIPAEGDGTALRFAGYYITAQRRERRLPGVDRIARRRGERVHGRRVGGGGDGDGDARHADARARAVGRVVPAGS